MGKQQKKTNGTWRRNPIARLLRSPNLRAKMIKDKRARMLEVLDQDSMKAPGKYKPFA